MIAADIDRQFAFLNEADKLKSVTRANSLVDLSRPENTAEHSWHLSLFILTLAEHAPQGVDINHVLQMAILHDIVEIDAGDHPIHEDHNADAITAAETCAAARIFGLLPDELRDDFIALTREFEAMKTPDAVFAKTIDFLSPIFQTHFAKNPIAEHVAITIDNFATGRAAGVKSGVPELSAYIDNMLAGISNPSSRLDQQLMFLCEADKLKSVLRATKITPGTRYENTAEHSWHITLYAMTLANHAQTDVQISRVIKMLILHDIVEIDAGDMPIHLAPDPAAQAAAETKAADRLFALLPPDQNVEFRTLWEEFEAAQTPDAIFAKSIDRIQPMLNNLVNGGGSWIEYNVTLAQIDSRVGNKVARGSTVLWDHARAMIAPWFAKNAS